MFRQGDVLLIPIERAAPTFVQPVPRDKGRIVLAYGEVTGHAHAISAPNCDLVEESIPLGRLSPNPRRWLTVVKQDVLLEHEEHGPIVLPPGTYIVKRQREYSPERIRNVAD